MVHPLTRMGTLLILLALGAAVMACFQVYSKSLKEKLEQKPLPPSTAPLSLGRGDISPATRNSITEGTTELLTAVKEAETGEISP